MCCDVAVAYLTRSPELIVTAGSARFGPFYSVTWECYGRRLRHAARSSTLLQGFELAASSPSEGALILQAQA